MKKLSKTAIIAITIVMLTAAAFGAGLWLLLKENDPYRVLFEKNQIRFAVGGEEIGVHSLDEFFEKVELKRFNAIYKPSRKEPIHREYEGFELKDVLAAMGADVSRVTAVTLRAYDGMTTGVFPLSNLYKEGELFIAVKYGGKAFVRGIKPSGSTYPEEDGGTYVFIKASDEFSQGRLKSVVEIRVEY
ncbi:MAG: hypothetical protein FWE84_04445 [Firmicutes bacterium]|nr:hypothetical protein [Bacillota bacterium]